MLHDKLAVEHFTVAKRHIKKLAFKDFFVKI